MNKINKQQEPEWKDFFGNLLNIICEYYDSKYLWNLFNISVEENNDSNLSNVGIIKNLEVIDPLTFISYANGNKNRLSTIIREIKKKHEDLVIDIPTNLDTPDTTIFTNIDYITKTQNNTHKNSNNNESEILITSDSINLLWEFALELNKIPNYSIKKLLNQPFPLFNQMIRCKGIKVSNLSTIMYLCKPNRYYPINNSCRDYLLSLEKSKDFSIDEKIKKSLLNHYTVKCEFVDFIGIQKFCSEIFDSPYDFYLKVIKKYPIDLLLNNLFVKTGLDYEAEEHEDDFENEEIIKEKDLKPVEVEERQPQKVLSGEHFVYKRNKQIAVNAICKAEFCCEYDREHKTFISKSNNKNFTEVHHLIPMAFQDRFKANIDVEANVVSLCSNCHKWIHLGKGAKKLISKLYEERRERLKKANIEITLEELLSMYK